MIHINSTFLAYKYRVIKGRILLSARKPFIKWAIMALGSIGQRSSYCKHQGGGETKLWSQRFGYTFYMDSKFTFFFFSSSFSSCSLKPPAILISGHQTGVWLQTTIFLLLSADMNKKLFMKMYLRRCVQLKIRRNVRLRG